MQEYDPTKSQILFLHTQQKPQNYQINIYCLYIYLHTDIYNITAILQFCAVVITPDKSGY